MNFTFYVLKFLIKLSPLKRRLIIIISDAYLLIQSFLLSIWLLSNQSINEFFQEFFLLGFTILVIGLFLYKVSGQYKGLTRYVDSKLFYKISLYNFVLAILIFFVDYLFFKSITSIRILFLFWLIITSSLSASRIIMRDILLKFKKNKHHKTKVAIYGAGSAGAQLAKSLNISDKYQLVAFIDDSPLLFGRNLYNVKIISSDGLENLKNSIDQVLIAIPSLPFGKRKKIIDNIQKVGLPALTIPSIKELTDNFETIDNFRPIPIQDLLGREVIKFNKKLIQPLINNSVVCVTGGGGSIGSELSRQILKLNPKSLIIIEQSEIALYKIEKEFEIYKNLIKTYLGSASNYKHLIKIFSENKVDIVFHAAAYKHVPIVEKNPIQGLLNNVLTTRSICEASLKTDVKKMILISTDKAVRPTNIMGASKRLSELIVQSYAIKEDLKNYNSSPKAFSMVRFGNVLGSSGSVIPLFQEQIAKGGPVTLTHKNVIRYFMTIKESVHLVLEASVFAKGGEVFLLDMGKPVKIKDLAEQMIKLSGLTIKDEKNPNGNIEIKIIGLRSGEKLFEELIIDAKSNPTNNELIFFVNETAINPKILFPKLDKLENALNNFDREESLQILNSLV